MESNVREIRLQETPAKQYYQCVAIELFQPITKSARDTCDGIIEQLKAKNKTSEIIKESLLRNTKALAN